MSRITGRTTRSTGESPKLGERRDSSAHAYGTAGPGSAQRVEPGLLSQIARTMRSCDPDFLLNTRARPGAEPALRYHFATAHLSARLPAHRARSDLFRSGPENNS